MLVTVSVENNGVQGMVALCHLSELGVGHLWRREHSPKGRKAVLIAHLFVVELWTRLPDLLVFPQSNYHLNTIYTLLVMKYVS